MDLQKHKDWPLETLWSQEAVDGTFRDLLRNFFGNESVMARAFEGHHAMMKIEEFLEGDTCVIRAEIPGIDPDKDVELNVDDGVLRLSAKREEKEESRSADGYRSEFHYGQLTRSLRLPEGATEADITASYKDGILEVRVPAPKKPVDAGSRKIPITRD